MKRPEITTCSSPKEELKQGFCLTDYMKDVFNYKSALQKGVKIKPIVFRLPTAPDGTVSAFNIEPTEKVEKTDTKMASKTVKDRGETLSKTFSAPSLAKLLLQNDGDQNVSVTESAAVHFFFTVHECKFLFHSQNKK